MRKLAIKSRGNKIETEHYGYLCLVDANGKLDKTLRDEAEFYVRSCIKPIQAKISKSILADELSDQFLTLAVASQLADNKQLSILQSMLDEFEISETDLYCGLKSATNKVCLKSHLHHYCAGKHIALIAAAKKQNLSLDYYDPKHPLQQSIQSELERLSKQSQIETSIDGCGLPTYYLSIAKLALAFTQASYEKEYQEIFATVNKYPYLISGAGRFDQELMIQFPNQFFAKSGADGMLVITNLQNNETLVIKILDGEKRVKDIVAKKLLEELAWIKKDELELDNKVYTSRGEAIGELTALSCLS